MEQQISDRGARLPSRTTRIRTYRFVGWWGQLQLMAAIALLLAILLGAGYAESELGLILASWGPIFLESLFEAWSCQAFLRRWRGGAALLRATCLLNVAKWSVVPVSILIAMILARDATPVSVGLLCLIAVVCAGISWYWVRLYRFIRVVEGASVRISPPQ